MPKSRNRNKKKERTQVVYSKPRKVLVGTRITAKGKRLIKEGVLTRYMAKKKYGKNVYKIDPTAVPIGMIYHRRVPTLFK